MLRNDVRAKHAPSTCRWRSRRWDTPGARVQHDAIECDVRLAAAGRFGICHAPTVVAAAAPHSVRSCSTEGGTDGSPMVRRARIPPPPIQWWQRELWRLVLCRKVGWWSMVCWRSAKQQVDAEQTPTLRRCTVARAPSSSAAPGAAIAGRRNTRRPPLDAVGSSSRRRRTRWRRVGRRRRRRQQR